MLTPSAKFVIGDTISFIEKQRPFLFPLFAHSRHTDTTSFPFLPENKNLSRVFDRFAAYALDRTLFRVCFTPEIEKALAFCKCSGRFSGFFCSVTAFESKGYVFVFSCSQTPLCGVWGRKKRPSFTLERCRLILCSCNFRKNGKL